MFKINNALVKILENESGLFSIVGSTGSGKSSFLIYILKFVLDNFKNKKVLLMSPFNETFYLKEINYENLLVVKSAKERGIRYDDFDIIFVDETHMFQLEELYFFLISKKLVINTSHGTPRPFLNPFGIQNKNQNNLGFLPLRLKHFYIGHINMLPQRFYLDGKPLMLWDYENIELKSVKETKTSNIDLISILYSNKIINEQDIFSINSINHNFQININNLYKCEYYENLYDGFLDLKLDDYLDNYETEVACV